MKKFASTYVFALVVTFFAVYTYVFEFKKAEEEKIKESEGIKLLGDFKEADITEINLKGNKNDIRLIRKSGDWWLDKPISEPADKSTIESIVTTLAGEKEEILKLETGTMPDLKVYGLETPSNYIELKFNGSAKKYYISKDKTYDGRQYNMKKDGSNQVYLVSTTFGELADKPLKDFRSKEIFGDITLLKFEVMAKGGEPVEFVRDDGKWIYPKNKDLKLDPKAFDDWIAALRYVKARDFVEPKNLPDIKSKYAFSSPAVRVKLFVEEKINDKMETKEIKFFTTKEKDGKIYLSTNSKPIVYEVTNAMISPIEKNLNDFRDKKFPFTFDEKMVTQVSVQQPQVNVTVEKTEPTWKITGVVADKILNAEQIPLLINKVRDLSVEKFLDPSAGEKFLKSAKNKINLKDSSGKSILELIWDEGFKEGADKFSYVKSSLSKEILAIRTSKLEELPTDKVLKPKEQVTEAKK